MTVDRPDTVPRFFTASQWRRDLAATILLAGIQFVPRLFLAGPAPGLPPRLLFAEVLVILTVLFVFDHVPRKTPLRFWRFFMTSYSLSVIAGVLAAVLTGVPDRPAFPAAIGGGLLFALLETGVYFGAIVLPRTFARAQAEAAELAILRAKRAELEAQAELSRIRARLEPHFVLNTLNAIAGLAVAEPKLARRLISSLGELLQDAVEEHRQLRPVREEVAWLERYAEILEVRNLGRLRFEWSVDERVGNALMAPLLLQPLVENAVEHGTLSSSGGGVVRISIHQTGSASVECIVEDGGIAAPKTVKEGVGLRSVRQQIELCHPGGTFSLENLPNGTRARVTIPYRAAVEATQ